MTRKVLIDCDPGIDDAVALAIALFDESLHVLAVTATEGNASAEQTTRNVQAIVDALDPPRYPRVGTATPFEGAPPTDARKLHGNDALANTGLKVSRLHQEHASDKMICDVVRADPGNVTIVTCGPLTNVGRALKRDPEIAALIDRIVIMAGTVGGIGNITPTAEFNVFFDPVAAKTVFQSPTTKTLIPLDITRQVVFSIDLLEELPSPASRVGKLVHAILPFLFRSFHQHWGQEVIYLSAVVALLGVLEPELFETQNMYGDVETRGNLTTGMTVFDRAQLCSSSAEYGGGRRSKCRGGGRNGVAATATVRRRLDLSTRRQVAFVADPRLRVPAIDALLDAPRHFWRSSSVTTSVVI